MSNILLFYVADPAASVAFYSRLLGRPPVEQSPTFALFVLDSGLALGLWRKDGVQPRPEHAPGACDLGFKVAPEQVAQTHADWLARGVTMLMPPTDLDFGTSFVAVDPDGHRLRVYALAEAPEV
ncbi:putative enzyme related to lactoylglutathione lyase [Rhodobacter viridis]|uniref:Putative enzyme related to lactoylglutathione lyase n=1 Tax=Rhodobacter viridis TaxID=1054202 RepID=A0A318TYQ9_9RHOB|nr:VOC family protein [Rhodobacter viridis]PYF10227.1 putative enzyme related to lactoylglutathione lyase [Rhodobacter viridis]